MCSKLMFLTQKFKETKRYCMLENNSKCRD
jgi:hypothetical protein